MAENPVKSSLLRLFLAIPFHDIFLQEISQTLDLLRGKIPDIKWVSVEQVHLTLHFFGSTPASQIELIDPAMRKIASLYTPMPVVLDRIGGFPNLKRPNVLWLGVKETSGRLLSLFKTIQKELNGLGFTIEHRSFHPHVTLGRFKKRGFDVENILATCPTPFSDIEKKVNHFVLYQSHCLPEGARYEILRKYPLAKKA